MASKLLFAAAVLSCLILASSCKKNSPPVAKPITQPSHIYIVGEVSSGAVYWDNGTMVKLIASTPSVKIYNTLASAIAISGDDVYISGFGLSASKGDTSMYWKNGTATIVAGRGVAHTIGVIGNDVYLGGNLNEESGTGPILWKNGVPKTFGPTEAQIIGITTNNSDLYVTGPTPNPDPALQYPWVASYYKNQQQIVLNSNGLRAWAYEVAVSGADIYVAGNTMDNNGVSYAAYWKNGVLNTIGGPNSGAVSICIANGDVYVGGSESVNNFGVATYWKNGVATHMLTNGFNNTQCNEIRVWGNDVYLVGNSDGVTAAQALMWKNGVTTVLGPAYSWAFDIAFKP